MPFKRKLTIRTPAQKPRKHYIVLKLQRGKRSTHFLEPLISAWTLHLLGAHKKFTNYAVAMQDRGTSLKATRGRCVRELMEL